MLDHALLTMERAADQVKQTHQPSMGNAVPTLPRAGPGRQMGAKLRRPGHHDSPALEGYSPGHCWVNCCTPSARQGDGHSGRRQHARALRQEPRTERALARRLL